MPGAPPSGVPPLAGLSTYSGAARLGYGVEENVRRLVRYQWTARRVMQAMLAHLTAEPIWEVKGGLALHQWMLAEHVTWLRRRIGEMRHPVPALDEAPDAALDRLLEEALRSREPSSVRREALLSLVRVDTTRFLNAVPAWAQSSDWRDRAVAADAFALLGSGDRLVRPAIDQERDGRVIARMLQAGGDSSQAARLLSAARRLIGHPDAAVRSAAADLIARARDPADIPALVASYRQAARDSFPDAVLSVLAALDTIATRDGSAALRVEQEFLHAVPRPESYLVRRWAEENWPEAAERWGPTFPVETGRTLEDYRELTRRFVAGTDPSRYPHVFLETEQRAIIELELFGPEAPLTVANFLLLVDRHYFDGNAWHRVVPNFVAQDGDRRGDGMGSSPGVIRDEINRHRYGSNVLGMALSGPDTGTSQWFLTHSPQPHLDGTYTVFGRVVSGGGALKRISQGDRINTIRR
jgi:cyclophilin family peptidyl-prolyl cis-trans isomerase